MQCAEHVSRCFYGWEFDAVWAHFWTCWSIPAPSSINAYPHNARITSITRRINCRLSLVSAIRKKCMDSRYVHKWLNGESQSHRHKDNWHPTHCVNSSGRHCKGHLIVSVNDICDCWQLIWSKTVNVHQFQQLLLQGVPYKHLVTWKFKEDIGL